MNHTPIPFLAAAGYATTTEWLQALQQAMPSERLVRLQDMSDSERIACDVAIVANPDPVDLQQLPNLRWVHSVWAGVERLVEELGANNLQIVRLVDPQLAHTMAEAVLAWTLYLHRDMPNYARQQRERTWKALSYVQPQQRTVGVLGLGALGQAAVSRLVQAEFKVLGWSRRPSLLEGVETFHGEEGLHELLGRTDILVCLLPLTPATSGLLHARALARLPPGASLINFARAAIVDDAAMKHALDSGTLRHAVLDVFLQEPLSPTSWHWQHERVTVLPHCSGPTNRQTAAAIVAGNIQRFRATGEIPPAVDRWQGY
jgi:glyoxylate/hydroxypyruvate reductase A